MPFIHDADLLVLSSPRQAGLTPLILKRRARTSMVDNDEQARHLPDRAPASVAQALEIARDSPEGARDPNVVRILRAALREIWAKVEAAPTSYVMTREEFAVFNYFQDSFRGQALAVAARRRYWDHQQATNGSRSS